MGPLGRVWLELGALEAQGDEVEERFSGDGLAP